ncbi:MAG: universal stress protein [Terriglobales bacterium]
MKSAAVAPRIAIKNILVMTDFSPASERALRYAAAWARRCGAKVHVAHFIRPAAFALAGDAYGELLERRWQEGRDGLAAIAAGDTLSRIPHDTYLDPGDIQDGLQAVIPARDVDLVVLSSTGRRGLAKVFLASTAEEVFRSVTPPVLMLGPETSAQPVSGDLRNILLATDFGPAAEHASAYAFSLAQESQARLHILHVLPIPNGECAPSAREAAVAEARLRAAIPPGTEDWCQPEVQVKFGRPGDEIVKAAAELGADLIVAGARRPAKLTLYLGWATAYQVLSEARCPVLTVREPGGAE